MPWDYERNLDACASWVWCVRCSGGGRLWGWRLGLDLELSSEFLRKCFGWRLDLISGHHYMPLKTIRWVDVTTI